MKEVVCINKVDGFTIGRKYKVLGSKPRYFDWDIVDRVEKIEDFFSSSDKRNINTINYNGYIDSIIKSLVEIKIK